MNKTLLAVALIVVVAGIGIFLTNRDQTPEVEPIKIGSIFSLTGYGAIWGENNLFGAELAVNEINEAGGVLGRPLKLINEDDASEFAGSLSAYKKLVAVDNAHLILSGWTENVETFIPLLEEDNVLSITVSAGADNFAARSPNLYRTYQQDSFSITGLIAYAKSIGIERILVFRSLATWEDGLYNTLIAETKKHGIQIVGESTYLRETRDFRTEISKLKGLEYDALVTITDFQANIILLKQLDEAGVTGPYLHPVNLSIPEYLAAVPESAMEKAVFAFPEPPKEEFATKFEEIYRREAGPASDRAYDAVYMLARAIEKAETTDIDAVKSSFEPFDGASGYVEFDENGDRKEAEIWIMGWGENGFERIQ